MAGQAREGARAGAQRWESLVGWGVPTCPGPPLTPLASASLGPRPELRQRREQREWSLQMAQGC